MPWSEHSTQPNESPEWRWQPPASLTNGCSSHKNSKFSCENPLFKGVQDLFSYEKTKFSHKNLELLCENLVFSHNEGLFFCENFNFSHKNLLFAPLQREFLCEKLEFLCEKEGFTPAEGRRQYDPSSPSRRIRSLRAPPGNLRELGITGSARRGRQWPVLPSALSSGRWLTS
jgi:hypothetical protein